MATAWTDEGGNEFNQNCIIVVDDDGLDDPNADFDTIQAAVDAASDGDEVLVHPGTYTNASTGKDIWIHSVDGPETTIINGTGSDVFSCSGPTTIEGFTITGGSSSQGGGFFISIGGSPTIINCIIRNNHATKGGGLYAQNAGAHLIDCSIIDNTCGAGRGGGLHLNWSGVTLDNCIIDGNGGGESGAAELVYSNITMNNCIINNNSGGGQYAGAIRHYGGGSTGNFNNCVFSNNSTAIWVCGNCNCGISGTLFCNNDTDIIGPSGDNGGNEFNQNCIIVVDDDGLDDPNADFDNIQEAVDAAYDGDEIIVMPGTYTSTTNQVVDLNEHSIWMHGIEGHAEDTIIDGENERRGMKAVDSSATIEHITFTRGSFSNGGAAFMYECDISFTDCRFIDNYADNEGGALDHTSGKLTVTGGTFSGNHVGSESTTGHGGAVHIDGGVESSFTEVEFTNNWLTDSLGAGGAIFYSDLNGDGTHELHSCLFDSNSAINQAGAVYVAAPDEVLFCYDSTFLNNHAGANGGAVMVADGPNGHGTAIFDGCLFAHNTCDGNVEPGSGAIFVQQYSSMPDADVTLCDSTLCGNTLPQINGEYTDCGTNIITEECAPPSGFGACCIQGVCIDDYAAQDCADAYGFFYNQQVCSDVICETAFSVDDDALDDPDADFNNIQDAIDYSGPGFVINVQPGTYTGTGDNIITLPAHGISIIGVPGSTIIDGQGERRGLIGDGCGDTGTVINGLTFANGQANEGAGAYLYQCNPEIINCRFVGNRAEQYPGNGGGLTLRESSPIVTNCQFIDNYAMGYGGGMLSNQDSNPIVTGCTFESNEADGTLGDGTGGGFHCSSGGEEYGGSAVLTDCSFINNKALNLEGGGVAAWPGVDITLTNCTFTGNSAMTDGGGLYIKDSTAMLTGCTFTGNISQSTASGGGGAAMRFESCSSVLIDDCIIESNSSIAGGGGVTAKSVDVFTIQNCRISDNTVTGTGGNNGGGLLLWGTETSHAMTIDNCRITGNAAGYTGGGLYLYGSGTTTIRDTLFCENSMEQIDGLSYTDNGGNTIRNNCDYWVVDDLYDDDPNADFDTIQEAVDAASDGDEIRVMPGTYFENVDIGGKSISLSAQGDFLNTKVNGGGQGAVLQSLFCDRNYHPTQWSHPRKWNRR